LPVGFRAAVFLLSTLQVEPGGTADGDR